MARPADRFMEKVDKDGPVPSIRPELGPCWLWTGSVTLQGYGIFGLPGASEAHRASYLLFKGPIPEGLEVDHLCFVRPCVNPAHLEAVTHEENIRRGVAAKPLLDPESVKQYRGCRCEECSKARRLRDREAKASRRRRLATSDVPHGRSTTYSNWLCRCAPCTKAWRLKIADYRRRKAEQKEQAA